jgi:hypothetical protein
MRRSELVTLVVSASPVIGVPIVDLGQDLVPWPDFARDKAERYGLDAEGWQINRAGQSRLLATFARRGRPERTNTIIFLSGDVHYGHVGRIDYRAIRPFESQNDELRSCVFVQLTSSPFLNAQGTWKKLHTGGYIPGLDRLPEPDEYICWRNPRSIGTRETILGLEFRWTTPSTIPAITRVAKNTSFEKQELISLPEWQYQISYIAAEFEIDESGQPGSDPPADSRLARLQTYREHATNFASYAKRWGDGKEIVGKNNLGEIRFTWDEMDESRRTVTQYLWWSLAADTDGGELDLAPEPLSKFVVSLKLDTQGWIEPTIA